MTSSYGTMTKNEGADNGGPDMDEPGAGWQAPADNARNARQTYRLMLHSVPPSTETMCHLPACAGGRGCLETHRQR